MQKYVFHKYDPKYAPLFEKEERKLRKVLGVVAKIEHVGSTAISNLGGKGILDILIGVSKKEINKTKIKLQNANYVFREVACTPTRLFFRRDYRTSVGKRRVHLHIVCFKGKDWKEMMLFRNFLRHNTEAMQEYKRIKKEAVKRANGDGEAYRGYKLSFIKSILKKVL